VASLSALAGTAAIALTGVGALIAVGAFGYAIVKALPPRMRLADDLVGQTISTGELANIFPAIRTLAIIGPTRAGKTTLKNRLSFDPKPASRTQHVSAYVMSLQTSPPTHIAILDAGGESFPQQFKLAELCQYLCIVIDHNISDTDTTIRPSRLSDHTSFLRQIRHHLDEVNATQKLWIHFLLNKHDLWTLEPPERRQLLVAFCSNEVEQWRQGNRAKVVDSRPHSNDDPTDVAEFMALLKRSAAS
jgi:hypothetical protein